MRRKEEEGKWMFVGKYNNGGKREGGKGGKGRKGEERVSNKGKGGCVCLWR